MDKFINNRKITALWTCAVYGIICCTAAGCTRSGNKTSPSAAPATASDTTDSQPSTAPMDTSATSDEATTNGSLIDIDVIIQDELESGCEIYAAVMLLHHYNYNVDEFTLTQDYLPVSPTYFGYDGNYYGPDMNSAFAGEPVLGYGAYAPVLERTINDYLADQETTYSAVVEKGITLDNLCNKYIDAEDPVMVWITTDMELSEDYVTWTVDFADENAVTEPGDDFSWPINQHCVLLTGFDSENFYFADSLEGTITCYDREQCEKVFEAIGSQAVALQHQEN